MKALKPKPKAYKVSDGEGLHLLVQSTGAKLWRLSYRFYGKQKGLALGVYPTIGLSQARRARDEARKLLAAGRDPAVARRAEKQRGRTIDDRTFAVLAKRWFQARESAWSPAYAARVWSRVENDLVTEFGRLPVEAIDADQILRALRKIEGRNAPHMARRVKQYAHDIFRFARAEKLVVANPVDDLEQALSAPPPKKRRAALKAREVGEFLDKLDAYPGDAVTRLAIKLALLTFVRTSELRFARWDELEGLDGAAPTWRIPAERMKVRNEHIVPLSSQAVAILSALRPMAGRSLMIFPATTRSGVISENTMIYGLYRLGYLKNAREAPGPTNLGKRRCAGVAVLNSGEQAISYDLTLSTQGDLLVRVGDAPAAPNETGLAEEPQSETWEDPRPYFESARIRTTSEFKDDELVEYLAGAKTQDERLANLDLTPLAAVRLTEDVFVILAETRDAPITEPDECHGCDASLSLVYIDGWLGEFGVDRVVLNFTKAGSWGHAVAKPVGFAGGVGFALDEGSTNMGEITSGCRVVRVTGAGVTEQPLLSKPASAERPFACE